MSLRNLLNRMKGEIDELYAEVARGGAQSISSAYNARLVATSIAAYTGSGTGTLTASVAGAIGNQDGVSLANGDTLFIPEGLANVAAVDAGPWTVVLTGGAAAWILKRPTWWPHGAVIGGGGYYPPLGATIKIGPEGSFWAGTEWKSFAIKGQVVDTNDPVMYPGRVTQTITLAAGSKTVSNVPIRLASGSNPFGAFFTRTSAIGTVSTTWYGVSGVSGGYIGAGSATLTLLAQGSLGLAAASDVSVGNLTIENW